MLDSCRVLYTSVVCVVCVFGVGEFIFTSKNLFGRYDCYLICFFSVCFFLLKCVPL